MNMVKCYVGSLIDKKGVNNFYFLNEYYPPDSSNKFSKRKDVEIEILEH